MGHIISVQQHKTKVCAVFLTAALIFLSFVLLFTNRLLSGSLAFASVDAAKQLGVDWKNFAQAASNLNAAESEKRKVYGMNDLYNRLYKDNRLVAGIVTPDAENKQELVNPVSGHNYNYVITLSNPKELLAFTYLTAGYRCDDVVNSIDTPNNAVSAFFRGANVMLGNNIDYGANLTYYKDDSLTSAIGLGKKGGGEKYVSNAAYSGFRDGDTWDNSEVAVPLLPVQAFAGVFDGQNFELSNLRILRNGNAQTLNPKINGVGYDSLFASVQSGGVVKNVGLREAKYVEATIDGYSDKLESLADFNQAAGLVGVNNGTVSHVYNVGAEFTSAEQNTLPTQITGTGSLSQYYTASTKIIDGRGKSVTVDSDCSAAFDAQWYGAASDLVPRITRAKFFAWPRLSGLKKGAAENEYCVQTTADFVAMTGLITEGVVQNNAVLTVMSDLNMRFVSEYAVVPALDYAAINAVTLTGAVQNKSSPAARTTIQNLRLNAFLEETDLTTRGYGLFYNHSYSQTPIAVNYLNFIDCAIDVKTAGTANYTTSAGLLAAYSRRPISVTGVGSNASVTVTDGLGDMGNATRLGGYIGTMELTQKTKEGNVSTVFDSCAFSGTVRGGQNAYSITINSINANRMAVGGFTGFVDIGAQGVQFTNCYGGGMIAAANPTSAKNVAPVLCAGALGGFGAFVNTNSTLSGVYVDATVHAVGYSNAPVYSGSSPTCFGGGFFGEINGAASWFFSAEQAQFNGSINAANAFSAEQNFGFTASLGYAAGGTSGNLSIKDLRTSALLGASAQLLLPQNNAYSANIGNLIGNLSSTGATQNLVNDRPVSVSGTFGSLHLGGIFGNGTGSVTGCVNDGAITLYSTAALKDAYVAGVGNLSANAETRAIKNCLNTGNITLRLGVGAQTLFPLFVSGVGNFKQTGNKGTATVENCANTGTVWFEKLSGASVKSAVYAAGVTNLFSDNFGIATNCYNGAALLPDGTASPVLGGGKVRANITDANSPVYVSGIANIGEGASTVSLSANYGEVLLAAAGGSAAYAVSGIAQKGLLNGCINYGAPSVQVSSDSANAELRVSGITDAGEATSCYNRATLSLNSAVKSAKSAMLAGITAQGYAATCVNYNDVTVESGATASAWLLGGIGASGATTLACINNGDVLYETFGAATLGGMVANATKTHSADVNNGKVLANKTQNNAQPVFVGGIVGLLSGGTVNNCFQLSAVTVGEKNTDVDSAAGGIVGALNNGMVTNSANRGSVSGANAGGVAGLIEHSARAQIASVLNYGAVAGTSVGGTVGRAEAGFSLSGAINYGNVTASAVAGGLLGVSNNTATTVESAVNYGAVSAITAGGIIGSCGSRESLKIAVFIDCAPNSAVKAVGVGTPAKTLVYTANNNVADLTLSQVYGAAFMLYPGDNEKLVYGTASTAKPTVVYSEYPYGKTEGTFHNETVLQTGKCFAVTTMSGRAGGEYVGHNFDSSTVMRTDAENGATLVSVLKSFKQIERSRDTFIACADNDGVIDKSTLQFYDKAKQDGKGEFSTLTAYLPPVRVYREKDEISILIVNTDDFFVNNALINGNFSLRGENIRVKDDALSSLFSSGAKISGYNESDGFTDKIGTNEVFDSLAHNPLTHVLTAVLTVYQGDAPSSDPDSLYTRRYTVSVKVYDDSPTIALSNYTDTSGAEKTALTLSNANGTETVLYADKSGAADLKKNYTLNRGGDTGETIGEAVEVPWNGATLNAAFSVRGLSPDLFHKIGQDLNFVLYQIGAATTKIVGYGAYTAAYKNAQVETVDVGGTLIDIPTGVFVSTARLTDLNYAELPAVYTLNDGAEKAYGYRLQIEVSVGAKTYIRSFTFTKQKSGDVFLHYSDAGNSDGARADGTKDVTVAAQFASLKDPTGAADNLYRFSARENLTVNTGYDFRFTYNDLAYGAMPAFGLDLTNPQNFFTKSANTVGLKVSGYARASDGFITLKKAENGTLYCIVYTFSVTAENGDVGSYTFTFNAALPNVELSATDNNGAAVGKEVTVNRADNKSFRAVYRLSNLLPAGAVVTSRVEVWYKADALSGEAQLVGTATPDTPLMDAKNGKLLLPNVILGAETTVQFVGATTGGFYTFVPYFVYPHKLNVVDLPNYAVLTDYLGNELTEFSLYDFTTSEGFAVNKNASNNAYLLSLAFSGNIPTGGSTSGYRKTESDPIGSPTLIKEITVADKAVNFAYAGSGFNPYVNPKNTAAYFNEQRTNTYLMRLRFSAEDAEADYTSLLTFCLNGEANYLQGADPYNDEFAQIYAMTQNSLGEWQETDEPLKKTVVYKSDGITADYATVQLFLPESNTVRVRVRAENPSYFNDYEFISDGPLKNKTFHVTVKAGTDAAGITAVVTLNKVAVASGSLVRGTNMFFPVPGAADAFTDGIYTQKFSSNRHASGTYAATLFCIEAGYTVTIESVTFTDGTTSPDLIFTKESNRFTLNRETATSLNIVLIIQKNGQLLPWGDVVYS